MPPKKSSKDDKKVTQKETEKIVKDLTFGIKNKNKSISVQQQIKGLATRVQTNGKGGMQKILSEEFEKKQREKKEEEDAALMASLYKTVDSIQNIKGTDEDDEPEDPKMRVCAYYKQGLCQQGKKCKYSHDLSLENQSEQIDLYTDQRSQFKNEADDEENSENWGKEKIEAVARAQESKYKNQKPTQIICKYFLDAIEKGKYGWKWMCPNGMVCHYRHCLPPGYTLKKEMSKQKPKDSKAIEQIIDDQISALNTGGSKTPVTLEQFLEWKQKRRLRKEKQAEEKVKEEEKGKGSKIKAHLGLTGRALFHFDPTVFIDDDEAADETDMQQREEFEQVQEEEVINRLDGQIQGIEEDEGEEERKEDYEENKNEYEQTEDKIAVEDSPAPQLEQTEDNIQKDPVEITELKQEKKQEKQIEPAKNTSTSQKQQAPPSQPEAGDQEKQKKQKQKKNKETQNKQGVVVNEQLFVGQEEGED